MKKTLYLTMLAAALAGSGAAYAETVYTWYNEDSASNMSEPPDVVYGAYSDDAEVREGNIQIFRDSDSGHNVEEIYRAIGGFSREGGATKNNAEMTGGTVVIMVGGCSGGIGAVSENNAGMKGGSASNLFGGQAELGKASKNTAFISGGSVENLYGGRSEEGIATINSAIMTGGSANFLYGGYSANGDATCNTASMVDGSVGHLYGGYSSEGSATNNTASMAGGYVDNLFGGYSERDADANGNTALVTNGEIGYTLIGGESFRGKANNNKVVVAGGNVSEVYGGVTRLGEAEACGNSVFITGGEVSTVQGAKSDEGACADNHVHLIGVGASITVNDVKYDGAVMQLGYVLGGESWSQSSTGNSVDIHGTGISAWHIGAGETVQLLNFYIVDSQAEAATPMLTLTSDDAYTVLNLSTFTPWAQEGNSLGFYGESGTDWTKFEGKSITLVSSIQAIQGLDEASEVDIKAEDGAVIATATLGISLDAKTLSLSNIKAISPVPEPTTGTLSLLALAALAARRRKK